MSFIDWIGFVGVFQILLAYMLTVIKTIKPNNLIFISLNLSGSIMACIASILINYIPFVILEGAWALVSLYSLFTYKNEIKKTS
tara:strand:+ start:108 stop:359 length:252 start_codon:yes stop_codon:yes gene_type:complete